VTPYLRPYVEQDAPFVRHAWVRGAASLADKLGFAVPSAKRRAQRMAERSTILVAYDRDEPTVLLGFVAFTGRTVHWVYVPEAFRGIGIGRALVRRVVGAGPWQTTSKCEGWTERSKRWRAEYVPAPRAEGQADAA
jgi:GNAT superfamily N-acetyltransferase